MKKYPIGIQSYEVIRSDDYYYADKTHFVKQLIESGKYFSGSRGRHGYRVRRWRDTLWCLM